MSDAPEKPEQPPHSPSPLTPPAQSTAKHPLLRAISLGFVTVIWEQFWDWCGLETVGAQMKDHAATHTTGIKIGRLLATLCLLLFAAGVFGFFISSCRRNDVADDWKRKSDAFEIDYRRADRERQKTERELDKVGRSVFPNAPSNEVVSLLLDSVNNGSLTLKRVEDKLDRALAPPKLSLFIALNSNLLNRVELTNDFLNFKELPLGSSRPAMPSYEDIGILFVPMRHYSSPLAMEIGVTCARDSEPAYGLECTLYITNRIRFHAEKWDNWSQQTYQGLTGLSQNWKGILLGGSDVEFPTIYWYPKPWDLDATGMVIGLKTKGRSIFVGFQVQFQPVFPLRPDRQGRPKQINTSLSKPFVILSKDANDREKLFQAFESNGW